MFSKGPGVKAPFLLYSHQPLSSSDRVMSAMARSAVGLVLLAAGCSAARPKGIWIMADDLGWGEVGFLDAASAWAILAPWSQIWGALMGMNIHCSSFFIVSVLGVGPLQSSELSARSRGLYPAESPHGRIATPNLDRFGREGLVFWQAGGWMTP